MDHKTIYAADLKKNKSAAAHAAHKMHNFAKATNLTGGDLYLNMFKIMVRSKLWYGLEVWSPPILPTTITLKPLGILHEFEQLHIQYIKQSLTLPLATPKLLLPIITSSLPLHATFTIHLVNFVTRIRLGLPPSLRLW